jgi:hypothetical protein
MKTSICETTGNSCSMETCRPQVGISTLLLTISLICVLLALRQILSIYSIAVLAIAGLTWIYGCRRTKQAVLVVTPCFLLPYLWLLMIDYPWSPYRWQWIANWGCLPGLIPAQMVSNQESIYLLVAAIITAVWLVGAVSLIRFWRSSRWWVLATTLVFNLVNSFGLLQMFHA